MTEGPYQPNLCVEPPPKGGTRVENSAISCLRTYGIEVTPKHRNQNSIPISMGRTSINFTYKGAKKLNTGILEEIVRRINAAGLYDVKIGEITDSNTYFSGIVYSDLHASQQRILVHFQLFDISIGYLPQEISVYEVVCDLNDNVTKNSVQEKKMVKARVKMGSNLIMLADIESDMPELIRKFAQELKITLVMDSDSRVMDRYKFTKMVQDHFKKLVTNRISSTVLAKRLTRLIVKPKNDPEGLFARVEYIDGSYKGCCLGERGKRILKELFGQSGTKSETTPLAAQTNTDDDAQCAEEPDDNIPVSSIVASTQKIKNRFWAGNEAAGKLKLLVESDQHQTEMQRLQAQIDLLKVRVDEINQLVTEPKELLRIQVLDGKQAENELIEIQLSAEV